MYVCSKDFPKEEMYGLTNQLRRAAISIPANLAEGCGKSSNADFAGFLNIFLGSANETEYYILLARDLKFFSDEKFESLSKEVIEIKAMLIRLLAKVRA